MEQIIQLLLEMDPSLISSYVNYFFIAIAAIGIIGFLIGFIKGMYKELTTLVITILYLAFVIFANKILTNAIYEVDISAFIEVPEGIKTIGDYLNNLFIGICEENGITIGNSEEMMKSIVAVSLAFINLVVYLVLYLAGIVIISVLDILIYFIVVRLIVPKEIRKTKKRRVIGGVSGLLRYIVIFSLLLTPFTAMVNSTVGKLRDEEGTIQRKELDNDFYNALMNVLEGYNNSALGKLFFIVDDEEGRSIDVKLMDFITKSYIDEEKAISLYSEMGNFGALAINAVSTGFVESTNSINLSLLLSADFVGNAIDTVAKSTLIQTILSVGATLAVNMQDVKDVIDLSDIDFMNMDWASSLSAVSSAYAELYNCGLIDEVTSSPEDFVNNFALDGKYAIGVKSALRNLGDNDLVCKIMPKLIVSFVASLSENKETNELKRANNQNVFDTLEDSKIYENIKWGSELASLYEVFENISKQYYAYSNQHLTIAGLNSLETDSLLNSLFGTGIDFKLSTDTSYSQQYERNVFVNGGVYSNDGVEHQIPGIKNIFGVGNDENIGLLNLQIVSAMFEKNVFNDFVSILDLNSMLSIDTNDIDLNEKIVDLISDWNRTNWKQELSSILDVVCPIMNLVEIISGDSSSLSEAKRASSEGGIELNTILGDDSLDCLKRVTDILQTSKIFDEILPDILETITNKETQELIPGLSISDLNFTYFPEENKSMIKELRKFINDVDLINENLIDLLENLNGEDVINELVEDCSKKQDSVFASLLKIIERNQIFNKHLTEEEINNNENKTFTNLMMNFLTEDYADSDMNLYSLTDGKVIIKASTIKEFEKSSNGWENEIDGLVGFIGSLKGSNGEDQMILDFLSGNTSEDFDLGTEIFSCGDEIERIFSSVDNSKILKEAFPSTFEMLIGDSFSDIIGGSPNFHNIESWAREGQYFNQLLNSIDSLRENGQSLTEIDWLSVEEEKLTNILTSLYNTQSVGGTYNEQNRDNGVFHSILKNIISQALESLEIKIEGDDVPEEDIIARDFDIDNNEKVLYKEVGATKVYVSWLGDVENSYDGEIKNITQMVSYVSGISGEETIEELEEVLLSVNDCYVLRNTLGLIIESKTEEYQNDEDELMREFISRSDFEVFHKEKLSIRPYDIVDNVVVEKEASQFVLTRENEVEVRETELKNIVAILNDADELASSINQDSEDGFSGINKILENKTNSGDSTKLDESKLERILMRMHDSKIFNSKIYDKNNERVLTAFEYFFEYILKNDAFIVDGISLLLTPTFDDIVAISNDDSILEDGWINGEGKVGEITNFNNSLYNILNNPLVDIKLDGLNFIEALQGSMAQKDSNGVSIKVDGELVRDETKTPIQQLLKDFHSSRLLQKSNGHILDKHIVNYLLKSIGYEEGKNDLKHDVERNVYQNYVLELSPQELKNKLKDVGVSESNINQDIKVSLWANEGKVIEDLIFAIDSDLDSFDINKFDSSFIDELITPLEKSIGFNYLDIEDEDYKNNIRSVYHLVVIKLVDTTLDAFSNTLGLYTENINDNLISSYSNEIKVSKDLIDAFKEMDKEGKFSNGNISFTGNSTENKEFMDLVVKVLDPLYRSTVYHNIDSLMNGENRITKVSGQYKELSNLTIFEQVVYTMLNSSKDLTNELYYDDHGIEYPETITSGQEVINLRIREISKMDLDETSGLKWIVLGSDNKVVYDCEIGKVHDMAGENLDSILDPNDLDPNDLDLTTIVKDVTDLGSKDKLLNIINGSYILHDIVPHVIAKYVSTHGAEENPSENTIAVDDLIFLKKTMENGQYDYYSTRGYAGESIDSYIIEHTYSDFFTRVEHWNNDLHYISQLTLLLDDIEANKNIGMNVGGKVKLTNVFSRLLYNLSMTETYGDAVPQIVISILNDKMKVKISSALELSLGTFIEGTGDLGKLNKMYELIDNQHGVMEEVTTYSAEIWRVEGEGIDMFNRFVQTRNPLDAPTSSHSLGYHMYNNLVAVLVSA